jgi:hypothetical protein
VGALVEEFGSADAPMTPRKITTKAEISATLLTVFKPLNQVLNFFITPTSLNLT